ncbi:hypothetical protein AB0C01_28960 [Micromonospora sp. NPDC048905]|uniref:hypothetical protein n=1 Tax=Micromonospora sp. NPDC048905 TaxID=3155494 RepID=UPI0034003030
MTELAGEAGVGEDMPHQAGGVGDELVALRAAAVPPRGGQHFDGGDRQAKVSR